jgi:hypothetical protein
MSTGSRIAGKRIHSDVFLPADIQGLFRSATGFGKKHIVGARLAGEGARKVHARFKHAFAGKPAPTD